MQTITLSDLAARVGGRLVINSTDSVAVLHTEHQAPSTKHQISTDSVAVLASVGRTRITDALPLQDATPGCITIVDHPKHLARLHDCPAAAVMVTSPWPDCDRPMVIVEHLHTAFQQAIELLRPNMIAPAVPRTHPTAIVAQTATLGDHNMLAAGVVVGENCVVGNRCVLHAGVQLMDGCILGDDCELYPHVTLYPGTRIGHRVLIHAGAVLGAYGFGYRQLQGRHVRTAQLGWVEVGDDVEIGAVTTIDRGTYGPTRIGDGTKIDNHVQIAHNCHIGQHNLICAQVGIAGSTSTGAYVVLAGQVGLADHIHLSDHVTVGAQSGVMGDVESGAVVFGSPAAPRRQRLSELVSLARMPEMRRELKALQSQLATLTAALEQASGPEQSRRRAA